MVLMLLPYVGVFVYYEYTWQKTHETWAIKQMLTERVQWLNQPCIPMQPLTREPMPEKPFKALPMDKMRTEPRYHQLWRNVTRALKQHMDNHQPNCLCMHHLQHSAHTHFHICATYLRGTRETMILINPKPTGVAKQQYVYREQSLLCGNQTMLTRLRSKTLLLEWVTVKGDVVSGLFHDGRATCFQLVMDEMYQALDCKQHNV